MYGIHAVTDETSGTRYAPASEEEGLLDRYTGSRVTAFGTSAPEYEGGAVEGGPPLIRVSRVESASASGEEVMVEFELTIEGEVPPKHSIYVESSACPGGVIYTTDADVLKQAGYPECRGGSEAIEAELAVPVGATLDYRILKSQGVALSQEVVAEGSEVAAEGLVVNASYSFAGPAGTAGGVDLNGDGVVNAADCEVAATVSDARSTAEEAGQPVLPATGGPSPVLWAALLLLVAGLLAHRTLR
jgi:hypothetical protein